MIPVAELTARRCGQAVLFCLVVFCCCMAGAMALYPGGTWLDRRAPGHSFFANFLCDLTQPVSLSGIDNRLGALSAQVGMLFFALALGAFFWSVPGQFIPQARATLWVRALGICAVLAFVSVPLLPSQRFGNVHALLALLAGGLGIGAAFFAVLSLARSHRRARRLALLGALALAVGVLDALLFVSYWGDPTPTPLIVPAAQKLAALCLCAWMVGAAWSSIVATGPALNRRR